MAKEPDDLVLTLLREIRDTQRDHSRLLNEHSEEFRRLSVRFEQPTTVVPGLEPGIQGSGARSLGRWIAGSTRARTEVNETLES